MNPKLPRHACFELHTLEFVGEDANALIIGGPGTGKSHMAKPVAYQATLQGLDVHYVEADTQFPRHGVSTPTEQVALLRAWLEPVTVLLATCSWRAASPSAAPSSRRPSCTNATSSAAASSSP